MVLTVTGTSVYGAGIPVSVAPPSALVSVGAGLPTVIGSGASGLVLAIPGLVTAMAPVPTVIGGSGAPITHGSQINPTNTGHLAYFDPTLGRLVTNADMTVHASTMSMSDFVSDGGTITRRYFQNGLIPDRNNVTLVACRAPNWSGYYAGVDHPFTINWCTADRAGAAGDDGIFYGRYTAYRCNISGSSDGAKINGNVSLTECYFRTKSQGEDDHNDGLQNNGGAGPVSVVRCNVDVRPVNGGGGVNGAFFSADGMSGTTTLTDNWFAGGQYAMRLHENGTYIVNGNQVLSGSYLISPVTAQFAVSVTWANLRPNVLVDASGNVLSTIAAP